MSFLSGAAAFGTGLFQGLDDADKRDLMRIKTKMEQSQLQGAQAAGQAYQSMAGVPQAPPPGQQSQPMFQPMQALRGMFGGGQPQGQPQGAPQPQLGPSGQPQGAPQMGGQPPQTPGQGGGAQANPNGPLDWRQAVQAIKARNPNLPPEAVAAAVDRLMPIMSMQSKQEWNQLKLQLQEQNLQTRKELADQRDATQRRGQDIGHGDRQAAEEGRAGRTDVNHQDRAAALEEKANEFQQRESRLTRGLDARLEQGEERLKQAKTREERIAAFKDLERAQAEYRDNAKAMIDGDFKLTGKDREQYLETFKRRMMDSADQIDKLKKQYRDPAGGARLQGFNRAAQPEIPGAQNMAQQLLKKGKEDVAAAQPPQEALAHLKEGVGMKFPNGQVWTLKDGKPERVQ